MSSLHHTSPERIAALHGIRDRFKGEACATQCDRLLAAMRELGSVTTYEAMRFLDIYDPRPRKLSLVRAGHDVLMTWRTAQTESGDKHRIGVYSLRRGAAAAGL
jgi:Helix-turn-helix domain